MNAESPRFRMKPGMDAGTEDLARTVKAIEYYNPNTTDPRECNEEIKRLETLINNLRLSSDTAGAEELENKLNEVKARREEILASQRLSAD